MNVCSIVGLLIAFSVFAQFVEGAENPFRIDFPIKQELTNEDYLEVQNLLRAIDIDPILHNQYVPNAGYTSFEDLKNRCTRGTKQTLIDLDMGLFPVTHLEKIGEGGDRCIISRISYEPKYISAVKTIANALSEQGFNGYFMYQMGGYPNPTGREIQYAGVPYAFKIFMMLEAERMGFEKVIWIDSLLLPIRDPTPLFEQLEEHDSFMLDFDNVAYNRMFIFPTTRALLMKLTNIDVVTKRHIATAVFGLNLSSSKAKAFIQSYYEFVAMGTPFISCFPEEFVFSAIMEQAPHKWPSVPHFSVLRYQTTDDPKEMEECKQQGIYFYLRRPT